MKPKFFGNEQKIRKQQIELISTLNRWYQVKEDMLFAFEKCMNSELKEPSKTFVEDFVIRVKCGMDIPTALQMLSDAYGNESFRYFIKQVEFNMKYRGNTGELLDNLETQFIKIDDEYTRRKIGTSKERRYLWLIFLFVPLLAVFLLIKKQVTKEFFLQTSLGLLIGVLSLLIYCVGLITIIYTEKNSR